MALSGGQRVVCWLVVGVLMLELVRPTLTEGRVFYSYTRYPFKKKQRNERKVRIKRQECEDLDKCRNSVGLDQLKCIRMCMSPKCYDELYAADELEDGEVDVRYNSFKGCVLQGLTQI